MDDRRKKLKQDYLEQGQQAGIFRIVNKETGRQLLGASLDVRAALNRIEFELKNRGGRYRDLQDDYDRQGQEAFLWEVVELVEAPPANREEVELELDLLEEQYLSELDRERSYNLPGSLRIPPKRRG